MSNASDNKLKVFLSHVDEDKPRVRDVCDRLAAGGFEPWLAERELLPGQSWRREIIRAVRDSDAVIVFLSRDSVRKAGFGQKVLKLALDVLDEQPEGAIFLIPVRLEPCEVPDRLSDLRHVDLFDTGGDERLESALRARARDLGRRSHRRAEGDRGRARTRGRIEDTPMRIDAATTYAELEISLRRPEAGSYEVELRFTNPDDAAVLSPVTGRAIFDFEELLALQHDSEAYGEKLTGQVFRAESVRSFYKELKVAVKSRGHFLRLRVRVAPSAPELHALRWELLADPETGRPLATSEKTLFSRFMSGTDWRPVKLRPRSRLEALVAVAAPSNLSDYRLSSIDRDGELARARRHLKGIVVTVAGAPAETESGAAEAKPLTLERLAAGLRQGVDIVYLVCHGALKENKGTKELEPLLYFEDEAGRVAVATGAELATRIAELRQPPRLVVLASCESGGSQASLAPRLAEAGVPAVVAMQDKITVKTVKRAMPVFFTELLEDGQIDRALAVARGTVRDQFDSWMPALYLRLKSGRIWIEPPSRVPQEGKEADPGADDGTAGAVRSSEMAYVDGFKHDVFLSYAPVDDQTASAGEPGWVSAFERHLRIELDQLAGHRGAVKIWQRNRIDGAEDVRRVTRKAARASAVFVALSSNGYLTDKSCRDELAWFQRAASADRFGLAVGDRLRIANVLLTNVDRRDLPSDFGGAAGFDFHDAEREDQIGRRSEIDSPEFKKQLRPLVDALFALFKALNRAPARR